MKTQTKTILKSSLIATIVYCIVFVTIDFFDNGIKTFGQYAILSAVFFGGFTLIEYVYLRFCTKKKE